MSILEITCTCCPLGCPITVAETENGSFEYRTGAQCGRGQKYSVSEASNPVRVLTVSLMVPDCLEPLSVKTLHPIPKMLVEEAVKEIKAIEVRLPVHDGQIICDSVCDTGIPVIATKHLP